MKSRDQGQGLLEFALIVPIMFVVLIGIFDLGRLYFASISLTSAAREGARYLSVYPDDISSTPSFVNTRDVTITEAENSGIILSDGDVEIICPNTDFDDHCDDGQPVIVTVTYDFDFVLGWLLPESLTITRSAQMVVP
jgi:hypothetical protein